MNESSAAILADPFVERLVALKIVPDNCRRMIIDCCVGDVTRVYYDCYGDKRLLDLLPFDVLAGAEITTVSAFHPSGNVQEVKAVGGFRRWRRTDGRDHHETTITREPPPQHNEGK